MTITNKAFRKAMEEAGLGKVELCKNKDYFYIYSEDEGTMNQILSLESTMILCHAFNDMTVEGWVDVISKMLDKGFSYEEIRDDLYNANSKLSDGLKIYEAYSCYTYFPGFKLNIPSLGDVTADIALMFAYEIKEAVEILNQLNDKYRGRKLIFK